MKVLTFVLVLFLSINVGVLYYIVLFGDVPDFSRRLDVQERRVDSLISQSKGKIDSLPHIKTEGSLVILTNQQKEELAQEVRGLVAEDVQGLLDEANKQITTKVSQTTSGQKEYFIPLGDASARTSDFQWKTLPVEVEFDRSRYGSVKQVIFEATLRVPTGNGQVYARLWDATAGVVGNSEIIGEGVEGTFVKSNALNIQAGRRTLKLQMKTSLDFEGVVENARLRVLTE